MPLLETAVPALNVVWFLLIAVLWVGFFFLEGFDFGVAMLLPILGRDDKERRVMVNTIGPTWDGNEVWLLTAGGATFAAFPAWYSTMFSALYLPLLLALVGLILRGVAFEYRSKHPDAKWRRMFDVFATYGSFTATLVLGVGFANFAIGLANDGKWWNGSLIGLFGPFALLGGVLFVTLFLIHGATFLTLKSRGEVHEHARGFVRSWGWPVAAILTLFVVCQNLFWPAVSEFADLTIPGWITAVLAVVALVRPVRGLHRRADLGPARADVRQPRLRAGQLAAGEGPAEHHHGGELGDDPDDHDLGGGDLRPHRAGLPGVELLGFQQAH